MENNNPLISVVIPVYNAENYLDNLLMDVINQTYQRLEIIVVNDGSTDRSLDIAKRYSQKDDRIKIINVPNGGVSKARNLGIENATGQYIRFVDADDRVPRNSTQYLIEPFQKNQSMDLSIGNFIPVPKAPLFTGATSVEELVDAKELANRFSICPRTYYYGVLWNKLYRADIINEHNIRFKDQLAWCEDLLFNIEYYIQIDKIAFICKEEGVYRYNTRVENSLTDKIDKEKKRYDEIEQERYKLLYDYFSNYKLEEQFRIEWENVNLYYRITNLVKKQDENDTLSKRYARFLNIISRRDTYSYLDNKKDNYGILVRMILLFGTKHKSYHMLFTFFIIKGKLSSLLGKYSKKIKKAIGMKIPLDY